MWPFTKKQKTTDKPPPNFDDLHRFEPDQKPYPARTWGWAPHLGVDLPDIPNQDAILVHWDRPPADENPQAWWTDRTYDRQRRWASEQLNAHYVDVGEHRQARGDDPRWNPPTHTRPTQTYSPSSYRFVRTFDPYKRRMFTGISSSMSSNNRSFSVGGMNPIKPWRNTYRLKPANRDATGAEMAVKSNPMAEVPLTYSPGGTFSRSYRLQ